MSDGRPKGSPSTRLEMQPPYGLAVAISDRQDGSPTRGRVGAAGGAGGGGPGGQQEIGGGGGFWQNDDDGGGR